MCEQRYQHRQDESRDRDQQVESESRRYGEDERRHPVRRHQHREVDHGRHHRVQRLEDADHRRGLRRGDDRERSAEDQAEKDDPQHVGLAR